MVNINSFLALSPKSVKLVKIITKKLANLTNLGYNSINRKFGR